MKKILYTLAAVAAIAFTASCNKEAEMGAVRDGDTINATFTIELPAQVATKAISDGLTAKNLLFYVYDEHGKYLEELTQDDKKFENKQTTVSVQLVKGLKYSFGFIAVADDNASGAYAFNPETKTLTVDYTKMTANDDQFDLFTAALNNYEVTGPFKETVTLHRPLAQVNVGTTDDDIKAAKATGIKTDEMQTSLTFSEVGASMNFLSGEVLTTATDVTVKAKVRPLAPAEQLVVAGKNYEWVAMAYVLTGTDKALTDVTLDAAISNEAGPMTSLERQVANAPIQRNHRTNIIGNIFSVTGEFTIIIDEVYDTPDYDYTNTLQLAFFKGGEVTLDKNEVIEHQLVVPNGSDVVLNLNGHTISNEKDIWKGDDWSLISVQGGSLTIKGEGKLDAKENDCYAIDVRDAGTVIIEGGEYIGNITAVYVHDGKADIRGGKFDLKQLMTDQSGEGQYRFMVNLLDANRTNKTASAVISGGTFHMFNPGNNAAEGAGTNFLEEGYSTTEKDDWYTVEAAKYQLAPLVEATAEGETLILDNGIYNSGEWTRVSKDITIQAKNPGKAIIDGKLTIDSNKTLVVKDLVFQNDNPYSVPKTTHQYHAKTGASPLSTYAGSIVAKNCKFIATQAEASIRLYGNGSAHNSRIENCTFEGKDGLAEHRPILTMGNVVITGCTFKNLTDDPGYCAQVYGGNGSTTLEFTNNTVEPATLPAGGAAIGLSISKSTTINANASITFTVKGNTEGLRYTWANKNGTVDFENGAIVTDDSDVAKSAWEFVEK